MDDTLWFGSIKKCHQIFVISNQYQKQRSPYQELSKIFDLIEKKIPHYQQNVSFKIYYSGYNKPQYGIVDLNKISGIKNWEEMQILAK